MSYNELISIENEYNYSANLQFDIENDTKMLRFIPNETSVSLLREYFIDITRSNPSNHSRILYGSYGTGKSHFLTILSMLLSKSHTNGEAYKLLLSRISSYDSNLVKDIEAYISDNDRKPLLIVPIVFDFDDFERCIYFSLKKKLEAIGKKISFKTFYDQAKILIDQWKDNEESLIRLNAACEKTNISLDYLDNLLQTLDNKAESIFKKIFSEMTFGVKYIYEVSNISESINQASESISDQYSGIVFIFDEFGRYIEDNIKNIKVKAVQDLAEYCDHCDGNNHIILVSHKEISQYTQRFGKSISNEWKKVEGRYKQTPINDSQDQCLSLIRSIIPKNDGPWNVFKERFNTELIQLYSEASDFKGFMLSSENVQTQFEGGFPLHPIALFALDKLSKRVAQNERTFFTYLASKDDNSLYRFLQRCDLNEFHFAGIDEIFDYFEPSIKSTQSDSSYEWYRSFQTALSKNQSSISDNTPEIKILKVITIIGIINDSSTLVANKSTLLSVIDLPNDIISNAIEELCEKRILKYSGAYDRYEFFEASIFDVESIITEESQNVNISAVTNTLNEEFIDYVLYPNLYNREYKISRVFMPIYATLQDLQKKQFINKFGKYYDGVLLLIIGDINDDENDIIEISKNIDRSILFVNTDSKEIVELTQKYISVKYLENNKSEYTSKDPAFEKELEYFKNEFLSSIKILLTDWKKRFDETCFVVKNGCKIEDIRSFGELSNIASEIMYASYPDTLIVNNELINKNSISGSIMLAKKNVINNILIGNDPESYYDVTFLSPEYISIRSVLVKNGFINTNDPIIENSLFNNTKPQEILKDTINEFLSKAKSETLSFEEIYSVLKEPPFGLRNGYLSLLLAHVLMPYKKYLIISSHGIEKEITTELFEEIIKRPADYSFTIANWSSKQIDYLDALESMFSDYISEEALGKNRLKAIYDAMLLHYKNISKFARTTVSYVSDETIKYRTIITNSSANYSTFLFSKIKNISGDFDSTIVSLSKIKTELEYAASALVKDMSIHLNQIFDSGAELSVACILYKNYIDNWKEKRNKSFDYYTNAFLDFSSKVNKDSDDYSTLLKLSKTITGFELLYWSDNQKDEFLDRIKEIKSTLDSYKNDGVLSQKESKMTLVSATGEEKSLVFDNAEMSALSKSLKNKIKSTFNNYGMSITYDEKIQVLLSLLEDFMEGN